MLAFSNTVSIGDAAAVLLLLGGIVSNYFLVLRRVDRIAERQKTTDATVEDLRHGIGLVLPGNWPLTVQRCFGFGYFARDDDRKT